MDTYITNLIKLTIWIITKMCLEIIFVEDTVVMNA